MDTQFDSLNAFVLEPRAAKVAQGAVLESLLVDQPSTLAALCIPQYPVAVAHFNPADIDPAALPLRAGSKNGRTTAVIKDAGESVYVVPQCMAPLTPVFQAAIDHRHATAPENGVAAVCYVSLARYWLEPGEKAQSPVPHTETLPEDFLKENPPLSSAVYLFSNVVQPCFFPGVNEQIRTAHLSRRPEDVRYSAFDLREQIEALGRSAPHVSFPDGTLLVHSGSAVHASGTSYHPGRLERVFVSVAWDHIGGQDDAVRREYHQQRRSGLKPAF